MYLVKKFAKQFYENIYKINFELKPNASTTFLGDLTENSLLLQLTSLKPQIKIESKKYFFYKV